MATHPGRRRGGAKPSARFDRPECGGPVSGYCNYCRGRCGRGRYYHDGCEKWVRLQIHRGRKPSLEEC